RDHCPAGPYCPACSNLLDDDLDGLADYPADPDCDSAADASEANPRATPCGALLDIVELSPDAEVMASVEAFGPNVLISPTCGGRGHERVYVVRVPARALLHVTTAFPE